MTMHKLENSRQVLSAHHEEGECAGSACPLHNMSDHALRHLTQCWNGVYMERLDMEGRLIYADPDDVFAPAVPNAARCLVCDEVLYSRSVHQYVSCSGDHVSVDGGKVYRKRSFDVPENFEDINAWPVPY